MTHAVLAILSDCYPPPKARLSTCYAPVRRFTQGRNPFLARLACVRPAANVRSEPGSNSPINLDSSNHQESLWFSVFSYGFPLRMSLDIRSPPPSSRTAVWRPASLSLLFCFQRPNLPKLWASFPPRCRFRFVAPGEEVYPFSLESQTLFSESFLSPSDWFVAMGCGF